MSEFTAIEYAIAIAWLAAVFWLVRNSVALAIFERRLLGESGAVPLVMMCLGLIPLAVFFLVAWNCRIWPAFAVEVR